MLRSRLTPIPPPPSARGSHSGRRDVRLGAACWPRARRGRSAMAYCHVRSPATRTSPARPPPAPQHGPQRPLRGYIRRRPRPTQVGRRRGRCSKGWSESCRCVSGRCRRLRDGGGHFPVLAQPSEFVVIVGAAIRTLLTSSPGKKMKKRVGAAFKTAMSDRDSQDRRLPRAAEVPVRAVHAEPPAGRARDRAARQRPEQVRHLQALPGARQAAPRHHVPRRGVAADRQRHLARRPRGLARRRDGDAQERGPPRHRADQERRRRATGHRHCRRRARHHRDDGAHGRGAGRDRPPRRRRAGRHVPRHPHVLRRARSAREQCRDPGSPPAPVPRGDPLRGDRVCTRRRATDRRRVRPQDDLQRRAPELRGRRPRAAVAEGA